MLIASYVNAGSASVRLSTNEPSDNTKNDLVYGTNNGFVEGTLNSGDDMRVKGIQCNSWWFDYVEVSFSVDDQNTYRTGTFTPDDDHGFYVKVSQISGNSSGLGEIDCY